MAKDKLARLSALLERTLDLPPAERAALLAELKRHDPEGERMLRRSLTGPDEGFLQPLGDTLRSAAVEQVQSTRTFADQPGDLVGAYRLFQKLGSGGMGTVWLAERVDGELTRQVALKLPNVWFPALQEHLQRERDILASLEHPHIARLYDAGFTETGRPWLALEYVDGEPLDTWCQARALPVEGRLRLFLQVARAVAYAHSRLVVHRDLKPANILVRADGEVRLLDFGIARLLDAPSGVRTTFPGARALTPDYASPEQITGERVTVASDVYSLGVVLYELLTGTRPYVLASGDAGTLRGALDRLQVLAPSQRVPARALAQRLRGDLDVIVLKALARDPAERYPSVEALAADVQRHLAGEPVLAQSPSSWYRLRKFTRRHRLAVGLSSLAVAALVAGGAVSAWQASVARAEARRAERVKAFVAGIFTAAAPRTGVGGEVTAADLLTAASGRLQAALDEEPRVAAELGVLIAEAFEQLGTTGRGLEAAKLAVSRAEQAAGPRDLLTLRARGQLVAAYQALGQYDAARPLTESLVADARAALPGSARVLVNALSMQSFVQAKRDERRESIASLEEAIALAERHLGHDDEDTIFNVGLLANTHGRFGDRERQLTAARDSLDRATVRYGAQRPHPSLTRSERWYGEALLFSGRAGDAVGLLERVVADQRALDAEDTPRVRSAVQRLGEAFLALGQLDRALPLGRQVVALEARHNPVDSDDRLAAMASLGRMLAQARLLDEAAALFDRQQAMARAIGAPRRVNDEVSRARVLAWLGREEGDRAAAEVVALPGVAPSVAADALVVRAQHARWQGHPEAALELAREAVALAQAPAVLAFSRAAARCERGAALLDLGRPAEAAPELLQATAELEQVQLPPSLRSADCTVARARLHLAQGRPGEAEALLRALDAGYAGVNPESPFRGEVLHLLGRAQAARGDASSSRASSAQARPLLARATLPVLRALGR